MTYRRPYRSLSVSAISSRAFFSCLVLAGAFAGATTVRAAGQGVLVGDPWMRFIMPARPAAGYFTLANKTSRPRTLVGVSSPACGMLMLHRSVSESGVERMTMVKGIDVPAHGEVVFAPGGYH
ncbi:MAG: copper chaperone PCu(A)C, partial [Gammaproteobacteria bacterium]